MFLHGEFIPKQNELRYRSAVGKWVGVCCNKGHAGKVWKQGVHWPNIASCPAKGGSAWEVPGPAVQHGVLVVKVEVEGVREDERTPLDLGTTPVAT